ncbi:hypothetical protein FACS1894139_17830 [Planctomycetales bacterium]|nr:hypothetical protein FACS1894108_12860 [Planctomycetales bacterium]GHT08297.1 hypothetical protein FACS1894139_17830 [Planctomycetales bacterium]GHV20774.1 hypothetical protein AGMMS49959_08790 [Planctomycetales bacterium]
MVQCRQCKQVRDGGDFRLPRAAELDDSVRPTYCPRCAAALLRQIQSGDWARAKTRVAV